MDAAVDTCRGPGVDRPHSRGEFTFRSHAVHLPSTFGRTGSQDTAGRPLAVVGHPPVWHGSPVQPEGGRSLLRRRAAAALAALPPTARRRLLHATGRYAPWEEGFDRTPPPAGPGETVGPPDFVGIGAQKAGTTWWHRLVCTHPQVWAPPHLHKERHILSHYGARSFGPEDVATYHGWFPRPPGQVVGEWTPDYLHLPWVPALLARAAPSARLLVLVRDPVERFRSGLDHLRRDGGRTTPAAVAEAVDRGMYNRALERWQSHFPPERILVLQYERCVADPAGQLAHTFAFLGLDPLVPPDLGRAVNSTDRPGGLDDEVQARLVELYRADVLALAASRPDVDLARWPHFGALVAP